MDHPFDIVEGPISQGSGTRLSAYKENGNEVWQAAFIGSNAMKTLIVSDIKEYNLSDPNENKGLRRCCSDCIVQ